MRWRERWQHGSLILVFRHFFLVAGYHFRAKRIQWSPRLSSNCVSLSAEIPRVHCFFLPLIQTLASTAVCCLCILWFFIVPVTCTHSHPLIGGPSAASCVILSALCQKLFCNICYYALDNNFITFSPGPAHSALAPSSFFAFRNLLCYIYYYCVLKNAFFMT